MTAKCMLVGAALSCLVWLNRGADAPSDKSHIATSVSIRKMADSLHAVIAADQQSYAELIVQRLGLDAQRRAVTENGHDLPVHAEMLRHSATAIQKGGAEFSYTLRSLWPIRPAAGPQTEAERAGLEAVAQKPEAPFYTEEELGGRSYFTAVYATRATLSSCISCHNQETRSPRKDFKLGEVMGAIVVRVPREF